MYRTFNIFSFAFLMSIGLHGQRALAQSNQTDQAIELLGLTLSCPPKPLIEEQLEPVSAEGTIRTFKTLSFTGSGPTFRLVVRTERRLHNRKSNSVSVKTYQETYAAPFSEISAIDIIGSDSAKNPMLALSCKRENCFSAANDSNSTSNESAIELPFCDVDSATKAKVALDILRDPNDGTPQSVPFELHQQTEASGKNLGEAIDGVSGAECLRKCRMDDRCKAFTRVHSAEYDVCQLKTSTGRLTHEEYTDTGVLQRGERSTPGRSEAGDASNVPGLSTRWTHNGSLMKLVANGASRRFLYEVPRASLSAVGVAPGSLVFEGTRRDRRYEGTAYIFTRGCGRQAYDVSGEVALDDRSVTLNGRAPRVDTACKVVGYRDDVLVFKFRGD